jgi:site-specific DNA recombinase
VTKQRVIRCAIYTRKSTEEGLDQEFNSLDAQREAGEAYIASQRQVGWRLLAQRYDDGGFSGGTLDRPALQRLLADVDTHQVDCVVVYKVDRLSRSLLDFARLMDRFDQRSVSFVSVTQQFNTTTSLGRLTLNILLSFAHYAERAIMQSCCAKVAVWRTSRSHWTPHYPSSNNEAISALAAPTGHRLFIVRIGAGRPPWACLCSSPELMNVVSARHYARHSLYL